MSLPVTSVPGRTSIIIPCFNQSPYVGSCIESVLAQRLENAEIIVVNGGSTDDSAARIQAFGDRINYVAQPNGGLSNARNTEITHAPGEFIQFLDADDSLGQQAISRRINRLQQGGAGIAVCRKRLFTATDARGQPRVTGECGLPGGAYAVHLCRFNSGPLHA